MGDFASSSIPTTLSNTINSHSLSAPFHTKTAGSQELSAPQCHVVSEQLDPANVYMTTQPKNAAPAPTAGGMAAGLSPALVETVAGLSAGAMATLIVHPLDIVKTRMQSSFLTPSHLLCSPQYFTNFFPSLPLLPLSRCIITNDYSPHPHPLSN